jgi:adenosylcobinamide kinase / adenosylcobinamide-phosphate guanylyltransferase
VKELILILGGMRSGKSDFAQTLASEIGGNAVIFVATAEPYDSEMQRRIERHRADRPAEWLTVEEPLHLSEAIRVASGAAADRGTVVIDCITLWVSNLLLAAPGNNLSDETVNDCVKRLLDQYQSGHSSWIVVSNEVGQGIIPDNALARRYADLLGRANRAIAAQADKVLLMVAGLPVDVKALSR